MERGKVARVALVVVSLACAASCAAVQQQSAIQHGLYVVRDGLDSIDEVASPAIARVAEEARASLADSDDTLEEQQVAYLEILRPWIALSQTLELAYQIVRNCQEALDEWIQSGHMPSYFRNAMCSDLDRVVTLLQGQLTELGIAIPDEVGEALPYVAEGCQIVVSFVGE